MSTSAAGLLGIGGWASNLLNKMRYMLVCVAFVVCGIVSKDFDARFSSFLFLLDGSRSPSIAYWAKLIEVLFQFPVLAMNLKIYEAMQSTAVPKSIPNSINTTNTTSLEEFEDALQIKGTSYILFVSTALLTAAMLYLSVVDPRLIQYSSLYRSFRFISLHKASEPESTMPCMRGSTLDARKRSSADA